MGLFNSLNSKKDRREEPPVKIVQVYEFGGGALPSCTNPTCTPPFFYLTAKIRQSWSTCIISIRSRPAADPPTWCLRCGMHTQTQRHRCITMTHTTQCPWQCQKKRKAALWDLLSEAELFTFSLFFPLILFGICFLCSPLFWWKAACYWCPSQKTSWLIGPGVGIDHADPLPWPPTSWLTA